MESSIQGIIVGMNMVVWISTLFFVLNKMVNNDL